MVRDAVRCHFEDDESPREIRLHFVRADGIELETASIGKSIKVHGLLSGRQDLVIDGCIEGSIDIPGQTVTIGVNGRIHASINALDVIIYGAVEGNIHAEHRVELHKTASLCGNISSSRISIHDGAYFRGSVDIHQPEHHQRFGTLHETIDEVISA